MRYTQVKSFVQGISYNQRDGWRVSITRNGVRKDITSLPTEVAAVERLASHLRILAINEEIELQKIRKRLRDTERALKILTTESEQEMEHGRSETPATIGNSQSARS